jgi:hypothetical protein
MRALAGRLAPFGIRPRHFRVEREEFARGYLAVDFSDAFTRYLEPSLCVHASTAT